MFQKLILNRLNDHGKTSKLNKFKTKGFSAYILINPPITIFPKSTLTKFYKKKL